MHTWESIVVSPGTKLAEAIAMVDRSGLQVALVVSEDGRLAGILTDGNVRRAILAGKSLDAPVESVMHRSPTSMPVATSREDLLATMRRLTIHHIPLVDEAGVLSGLATLDELIGVAHRPNWVVLMAGGLGTRLRPLTANFPKPLLEVGGRPILETILESFAEQGFKRIFVSLNYKAELIKEHFGDGGRWGVDIEYLHEPTRLGTAGALSILPERPAHPLIVMNGDLVTKTNFDSLLQFHSAQGAAATMAVREYDFQIPYGVVRIGNDRISAIEEKPVQKFFVNAGIYALSPETLDLVPNNEFFNMPTLFDRLIAAQKVTAAYLIREYWLDIGRLEEYERARRELTHAPGKTEA